MIAYKCAPGLRILFIGTNPHPGSFRRGVPLSNNKSFWYQMGRAGLIHEDKECLRDDLCLKRFFEIRFLQKYRLGFVNLVHRPTKSVSGLKKGEEIPGRKRILSQIRRFRPEIACFIGKTAYLKFAGIEKSAFGWQKGIFHSKAFVMHFPIRGKSSVRVGELKEMQAELKILHF